MSSPSAYCDAQGVVEAAVDSGKSLSRIDDMVDVMPGLEENERDALKAWAWAWRESRPRFGRRRRLPSLIAS